MRFFFPDSQDLVDPSFDFDIEQRAGKRLRQRDDAYAHEVFSQPAYDGILVSKGIVEGFGGSGGRYTLAQRHRLLRVGAPEFFRLDRCLERRMPVMGDCGAFTYAREQHPPYSVDEVLDFYSECRFDMGTSVDHVILSYQPAWDEAGASVPDAVRQRQEITLELADEFLKKHRASKRRFEALGIAQGWSPKSYAAAVSALQRMGYRYIALGGMVPLKNAEILAALAAVAEVRRLETRLHLLGVTRVDCVATFEKFGVESFDSTSPLRQAFKDDKDNYYTLKRAYTAIRIPQVEGNPGLQKRIRAGIVKQELARRLERSCLDLMQQFDRGEAAPEHVLECLREYEHLYDPAHDHSQAYAETLRDRPWQQCGCDVCKTVGHHVILFRGAERNRRRGFHNLWVFYRRLLRKLDRGETLNTRGPAAEPTSVAKNLAYGEC